MRGPAPSPSAAAMARLASPAALACGGGGDDSDATSSVSAPRRPSAFPATRGQHARSDLRRRGRCPARSRPRRSRRPASLRAGGRNRVRLRRLRRRRHADRPTPRSRSTSPTAPDRARPRAPIPARIESLETDPAFRRKTTARRSRTRRRSSTSPTSTFEQPGRVAHARRDQATATSYDATRCLPSAVVKTRSPDARRSATRRRSSTPRPPTTVGDVSKIDTRIPPDDMHDVDLADVLGKKPVVLLFATPALCQSRVCGPVVDVAEQVQARVRGRRRLHPHGDLQGQQAAGACARR